MESDTNAISYVTEPLSVGNRKVVLVDTIGLGGSGERHNKINFAADWVKIFCPGRDRCVPYLALRTQLTLYHVQQNR